MAGAEDIQGAPGARTSCAATAATTCFAVPPTDLPFGGAGTLEGGNGRDVLFGDGGRDLLRGGNWRGRLEGGSGNDTLRGGAGADTLLGEAGDDLLPGGRRRAAGSGFAPVVPATWAGSAVSPAGRTSSAGGAGPRGWRGGFVGLERDP